EDHRRGTLPSSSERPPQAFGCETLEGHASGIRSVDLPLMMADAQTCQVRVLVASPLRTEFHYAELRIMKFMRTALLCGPRRDFLCRSHELSHEGLRITVGDRSAAIRRSGGRNLPGRSMGGAIAARASSFSVGSACR